MKLIFTILFSLFLFQSPYVSEQALAMATEKAQIKFETYSTIGFSNNNVQKKWCDAHTAGVIMVVGGIALAGGALVAGTIAPQSSWGAIAGLFYGGGVLVLVGAPILIGGAIHDHHNRKISLVVPKSNQIGLAYNF